MRYFHIKSYKCITDIVESVLGVGKKAMDITPKQAQAAKVIINDIKEALGE